MDNTSGCQLYLGKDSLGASITTAKSSEINVLVPGSDPSGDWVCLRFFCLVAVRILLSKYKLSAWHNAHYVFIINVKWNELFEGFGSSSAHLLESSYLIKLIKGFSCKFINNLSVSMLEKLYSNKLVKELERLECIQAWLACAWQTEFELVRKFSNWVELKLVRHVEWAWIGLVKRFEWKIRSEKQNSWICSINHSDSILRMVFCL